MKIKNETIIRTAMTAVTLLNTILVMLGKLPLPWDNEEMYTGLSAFFTVCTTIWSWWKNNSFTPAAIEADTYLKELKTNEN